MARFATRLTERNDLSVPRGADSIAKAAELFDELCDGLGILYNRADVSIDAEIEALIEERQAARKAKDFARSDAIRDELKQRGITLEDTPQGVKWSRK